jgi:prolipoprotein diacylglyceryltransferase
MLPTLQIGPLSLQTPGLAVILAIWLGLNLAERHAAKHGLSGETLYNLFFSLLIGGLIGGRLIYVLRFPQAFLQSPASLFDLAGGLLTALLTGLAYARQKALHLWKTLDALTPFLATLAVGIALAHLAGGTAFGKPADLPWAIELWGARRHPTQLYELLGSLLTLGLLWPRKAESTPGVYFLRFAALTSGLRLFLEAFRGDSALILGGLRLAQIAAWLILAAALSLLAWREKQT